MLFSRRDSVSVALPVPLPNSKTTKAATAVNQYLIFIAPPEKMKAS
jgi:hypothetical protein